LFGLAGPVWTNVWLTSRRMGFFSPTLTPSPLPFIEQERPAPFPTLFTLYRHLLVSPDRQPLSSLMVRPWGLLRVRMQSWECRKEMLLLRITVYLLCEVQYMKAGQTQRIPV